MATTRNSKIQNIGIKPPMLSWGMVRGDTASFKAYVTDDSRNPLTISDWTIAMKVKRPNNEADLGVITDNAELILETTPAADINELPGYFTVSLSSNETKILETGDIFDIQISQPALVWTVAQGKIVIFEDVTD